MMRLFLAGAAAFCVSVLLTAVAKGVARRLGVVARPKADRWHRTTVPLLGGVAISLAVLAVMPLSVTLTGPMVVLLAVSACALGLGLLDDVKPLNPQTKLIAQIVLATAMVALGLRLQLSPYPAANFALTLFWVVGIANAFNLLDNMDGLAAGIAAITVGFRLAFFLVDGDGEWAAAAAVFLGALVGFLVFNFPPASIFMGDAGSLFIGVFVAGLSLGGQYPYSRNVASVLLIPVLILVVPILDTSFVAINRTLAGRRVSQGGRDHLSHRLVALGLSERGALGVLSLLAACAGGVAYLSDRLGLSYGVVLIAFLLVAITVFAVYLSHVRVYPEDPGRPGTLWKRLRAFGWQNARAQQVAAVCLDAALIGLAYHTAYLLRFEDEAARHQATILSTLPIVIVSQLTSLALFKVHQVTWRYVGLDDLLTVIKACTLGTLGAVAGIGVIYGYGGVSPVVFILDWMLLVAYIGGARLFFRLLAQRLRPGQGDPAPVLIYGAGDGGVLVLRELLNNPALGRVPVGFVDDDPSKQRLKIHGIPVVGAVDQLGLILQERQVAEVLIATERISAERLKQIGGQCSAAGVRVMRASLRLQ